MANNAILQIIKGVQKTPGDNFSAEQGLDVIDLLDAHGGFSDDAYEMKIPSLKSSAIYADSPLTDGRTLISGTIGNVTETIRVTLNAGTIIQLAAHLSRLNRFKQDCNDFWDTFYQIEPVYIRNQVAGEPGPRYALLYDIDIAIADPINPTDPIRDITIVIEREYGWRGIAPGANPKQWTMYKFNQKFNVDSAGLNDDDTHLVSGTVMNGDDLTTINTFTASNALTVPAAKIDGDLPALTFINVDLNISVASMGNLFIARDTRPLTMPDSLANVNQLRRLCIIASAGDLGVGVDTTFVNDTGASRLISSSASGRRTETTFATVATDAVRWTEDVDINTFRGRYMMFARVRQHTGAQNDLQYYVTVEDNSVFFTSPSVYPLLTGTSGNTTSWNLDYLGVITLPANNRSVSQVNKGAGLTVANAGGATTTSSTVRFSLRALRVAGATARLCFNDIVLIPIDEAAMYLGGSQSLNNVVFDNTGYLNHGGTDDVVQGRELTLNLDRIQTPEVRGNMMTLKPGVDNRILVMGKAGGSNLSSATGSFGVHVDIVPRWSGLRDV